MLEDIRALVELADAGSVVKAADQMFLTASAVTRKLQRLERALQVTLLDRSVKPPRLTPLGRRILDQGRDVLRRVEDLKASASTNGEPRGPFRLVRWGAGRVAGPSGPGLLRGASSGSTGAKAAMRGWRGLMRARAVAATSRTSGSGLRVPASRTASGRRGSVVTSK